ncbi:hypothetical protein INR49_017471 [Caranx melampygus]|nr:hypothetical protein INR49_017471 [Caranx melampygus]
MELLEVFYRRKLRKKQKKADLGRSDGTLCRSPSEASVNILATGLISKVLRFTSRRSEPASRPHSWHSSKLAEARQEAEQETMDTMSSAWHRNYHSSVSTTDLSGGFDSGGSYLRKSPDQYSSRGSMESLDPPQSSHLHSGAQHQHSLGLHTHGGPHPTYSSCHQLSSARSSNSIDHLHSKRDSAYSSFSTSSSIPEYLASNPSFSPERSYSLETVPQRGRGSDEMQQTDVRYIHPVYDAHKGLTQEHEYKSTSALLLRSCDRGEGGARAGLSRDVQGGVRHRGSSSSSSSSSGGVPVSNRHSVGPIWSPAASRSSYESLRGVPPPPRRSDSYAAIRNHERPNSWSTKGSYGTDCQLHTVIEKSPESSPTTKPRQGGGFPPSPPEPFSGPADSSLQSGRLIFPQGGYSAPQPEPPHYAQMPSTNPATAGSSAVCPTLSKESSRRQHQGLQGSGGKDDGVTDVVLHDICLLKAQDSGTRCRQLSAGRVSPWTLQTPMKTAGGGPDGQTGSQMPHHQPPHSQSYPQSYSHKSHGLHSHVFQEHNHTPHTQSTTGSRPQAPSHEWRDPYTPVLSRGDRSRSQDQTSILSDPVVISRPAQRQVPPTHSTVHPQPWASHTSQTSPRHHSDSAATPSQHWDHREWDKDREHPLTRLEIALAEVQGCATSDSNHSNSCLADSSQGPASSLSVLEKVSHFERRERVGKQRSHSTKNSHNKATVIRMGDRDYSTSCRADDLRNMLERSTNGTKAHRTLSCRGGNSNHMKHRAATDPSSALQRSQSSFQLDVRDGDSSKDFPQRQGIQEILGSMQDTSSNSHQPTPVPVKYHSLEKKGPKTMPKPQGIIITGQTPPVVASIHTPKERHVVSPEVRGPSPPALPSIPPVGHPSLIRICGRKRLTADQKKRSYSEPENMNEVGVPENEAAALFRRGGETSVADRRKMFELAASHVRSGPPQSATSKPDLRQLQHDALVEYLERKRSVKRDEGGKRSGPRPHSVYLQPDNGNHSVSSCYSDSLSLSSASSLLSLQDSGPERGFSGERRLSSTLPSGGGLCNLQSNLFYSGRATTPRPLVEPPHSTPPGSAPEHQVKNLQNLTPEAALSRLSWCLRGNSGLSHQQQGAEPQDLEQPRQFSGALQRTGADRSSGKSVSAEDLLERTEERQTSPQHCRSHSSPTVETLDQDSPPGEIRMFGVFMSGPGRCSQAEDRPTYIQESGDLASSQPSQNSMNTVQPMERRQDPGSSYAPVTRRERQRNNDRQRAHSTSSLAASVGMPCPFSPPGTGSSSEWQASERLSLANLGDITFPGTPQTSTGDSADNKGATLNTSGFDETMTIDRQARHSLSDVSVLEDTEKKNLSRDRAHSLEHSAVSLVPLPQLAPPPDRKESSTGISLFTNFHSSPRHLQISESRLFISTEQQQPSEPFTGSSQRHFNDVFLQKPLSASPPIEEEEDFPPPPPPLEPSSEFLNNSMIPSRESSTVSSPTSAPSTSSPPVLSTTSTSTVTTTTDARGFEYQPLPKREKTPEELKVETLARQLLMEEIFPNSKLVDKSHWQDRGRIQAAPKTATNGGTETNLDDDDEKDLNSRKVELCDALRSSVEVLQQEKEVLCEEQRNHQAQGTSIEALLQERLKTNERDKYSMFIGDLERIVNLLLSLCSRLSRIERSLLILEREGLSQENTVERDSLHHKRSLLLRQTEDAWELKENLDRRQQVVHTILSGCLSEQQLQDCGRFVSTIPSLLIRQRHLEELIRQGEEQLTRLVESLPAELAEAHGWSSAYPFSSLNPVPCSSHFPPLLPQTVMPGPVHSVRSTTVTSL